MEEDTFHTVKLPDGCTLRRKQTFEYITPNHVFDVEFFENQDHSSYAIAVPRDTERLMVFGTRELNSESATLRALADKIRREENLIDGANDMSGVPDMDGFVDDDESAE